ncbi:hypothetical protein [Luteipulveratus flavus]|uniref:DUF4209 domain-containing protein n=1 Tax=Luteipulveratus flavus TaxID=3031728 RepID=A0ABT6CC41_9MICO|nr:hypothetical protein [Luteipulveratus sp. YIM 133296]MDF8266459.1 hypothetical protein [Luteipulveratus sp. YIM 133296]
MFSPDQPARGYALTWPRELFRAELQALLARSDETELGNRLELLFEEAFHGPHPQEDARYAADQTARDFLASPTSNEARNLATCVLEHLDTLPMYARKRYFRERQAGPAPELLFSPYHRISNDPLVVAQLEWGAMVAGLDATGYLDRFGGDQCVDGQGYQEHNATLQRLITRESSLDIAWPPMLVGGDPATGVPQDDFLTLVEVVHDLVARPQRRWTHDYEEHYDYADFDEHSGQAVYRWKVNELLARHLPAYRIAEEGEDVGLVVAAVADPRADLLKQVREDVPDAPANLGPIDHAIALFRSRDVTIEDKRSACKDLADVLEHRRSLLRDELLTKDEGLLFQLANGYRIRHHRAQNERGDYAEEFLDWIFWNFLSAVELSNRLLTRAPATPEASSDG